jgi:hypothetical protein
MVSPLQVDNADGNYWALMALLIATSESVGCTVDRTLWRLLIVQIGSSSSLKCPKTSELVESESYLLQNPRLGGQKCEGSGAGSAEHKALFSTSFGSSTGIINGIPSKRPSEWMTTAHQPSNGSCPAPPQKETRELRGS